MVTMGFTIKELESLSGIKAHTIRIWEQRYHFLKPSRTATNIRTYSNEELKEILTVALLNKYGYKISRIDSMAPDQRRKAVLGLQYSEAIQEQLVNDLIGFMIDLDISSFENLLNDFIKEHGIADTITSIIFQFMHKVGILWQTSRINPAHEHIVTNIIRQKIIAAIEALPPVINEKPLHLLFLPEDEHHELGLLFVDYLLKQKGVPVIYLGASVPLKDVCYVVQMKKPAYLYLHLTSLPIRLNFPKYLSELVNGTQTQIMLSGFVTEKYKSAASEKVSYLKSFDQLSAYLSSL